ncbi:MFS transporter [Comamonas sp. JC664]|uniref:MFS transporter n=1 Tax=Comamonas sp. JC664 TaxID=2801917 RepID=UPI00174AEEE4|nr:MFS transporter [Comamonas sp. JC664]MBL0692150.1 MFS transporter [Comamonas sp. JC664]GHG99616.1 tetracycline resistance MFS efflux pump [Comamonas sp. KCTC 72670]
MPPPPAWTSPAPLNVQRRVRALVFITVFLDLVGFGLIIPLLPFYVESMGGTATTAGVLLALFSLAQLIASPVLGRLSDRVGRRPVILLSLLGNALSMALFAYSTHVWLLPLLFASRLLAGATAGNLAACQAAVADVTDERGRAAGMGRVGAGIGLGMVLGPVIGSVLHVWGAWAPPLAGAVLAAAAMLGVFFFFPETHRPGSTDPVVAGRPRVRLPEVLARPGLGAVLALMFLVFIGMTNLQVSLGLLAQARFGWGELEVGRLFALMGLTTFVLQAFVIGWLTQRFRDTSLVLVGATCMGTGLGLIAAASHGAMLVLAMVLVGSGTGLLQPLVASLASTFAGRELRGGVLGVVQSAGGLARVVGPVWSGFLYSRLGPGAPFASGVAASGIALLVAASLRRRRMPDAPPPSSLKA